MMGNYKLRVVDKEISLKLRSVGAMVIEGAKWCGKSTTGAHHSNSLIYLDDPTKKQQYRILCEDNPDLILEGATPRLIDEWQILPIIWDAVRFKVDHRHGMGQFILTGSAKPADRSEIHHSGTGRMAWLRMRPMSLMESGDSTGQISLSALFDNPDQKIGAVSDKDLTAISYLLCRGGWPAATDLPADVALEPAKNYFDAVVNVDISQVDGTDRSVERAKRLMKSYARFQGTQTPVSQIVGDINGKDTKYMDERTAANYLNALRSMFVIEEMPSWNPNLKSKSAIRSTETRYFVDPSIATSALGIGPGDLMNDLKAFGLLFETLCVRDLRVYAQPIGGEIFHYRDKNGLECDAVVHLRNGRYGLVEIKLGGETQIEAGAATLKKLSQLIDTDKMNAPSFLMVLTATGAYAYRRKDNVIVAPIATLGV